MKLLLENWRKFLNEEYEPITVLRIFDFDETIAHTRSETRVEEPDGNKVVLSDQKEFEAYMQQAAAKENIEAFDPVDVLIEKGYKIDLSDFSIVKDPEEITIITDILRQFPEDSKTYVMTARRGNSLGPILDYLELINVDIHQVRPIATQGESKGLVIANMIRQKIMPDGRSNIHKVEYFEDSQKNVDDVIEKVCKDKTLQEIKPDDFQMIVYKVDSIEGGHKLRKISCN
tara:strand:+ start:645 stop:1334 length:690 start_codon:yes stop_codon:yes gene_type:complete